MVDRPVQPIVASVIEACGGEEALLDYLWVVMEADDDGIAVDAVVNDVFGGDPSRWAKAQAKIEASWRGAGGGEVAESLIRRTSAGSFVLAQPARKAVFEQLDTD